MSELTRFLAGDHAKMLRNIAIVIQPMSEDHLRALSEELNIPVVIQPMPRCWADTTKP